MKKISILCLMLAIALVVASCSDDNDSSKTEKKSLEKIGKGEGQVNIIAWAGYAEDGTTDPAIDWVTDFEKESGCEVNVKVGNTSDEMVQLMQTGEYDGVSASGDASLRLIAGGDVSPVNTDLIENYKDVSAALKNKDFNSVDGQMYGVPHGFGANLLMYNTDIVNPAPTSWSAVFDPKSPYKSKITAYDSPIYIADAALYLKSTQPDLKIENPYALDQKQFDAAIDLLTTQKDLIGEYWSDYLKSEDAFTKGSIVLGTTWQVIANTLKSNGVKVDTVFPSEGSTGWSDTWMISSKAEHPNCMYMWMNHIISPKANAAVAEYFGEAPSNLKACAETSDVNHCDTYHAEDEDYINKISFWTTPTKECLDGRKDVECKTYTEWTNAWNELKG